MTLISLFLTMVGRYLFPLVRISIFLQESSCHVLLVCVCCCTWYLMGTRLVETAQEVLLSSLVDICAVWSFGNQLGIFQGSSWSSDVRATRVRWALRITFSTRILDHGRNQCFLLIVRINHKMFFTLSYRSWFRMRIRR